MNYVSYIIFTYNIFNVAILHQGKGQLYVICVHVLFCVDHQSQHGQIEDEKLKIPSKKHTFQYQHIYNYYMIAYVNFFNLSSKAGLGTDTCKHLK